MHSLCPPLLKLERRQHFLQQLLQGWRSCGGLSSSPILSSRLHRRRSGSSAKLRLRSRQSMLSASSDRGKLRKRRKVARRWGCSCISELLVYAALDTSVLKPDCIHSFSFARLMRHESPSSACAMAYCAEQGTACNVMLQCLHLTFLGYSLPLCSCEHILQGVCKYTGTLFSLCGSCVAIGSWFITIGHMNGQCKMRYNVNSTVSVSLLKRSVL